MEKYESYKKGGAVTRRSSFTKTSGAAPEVLASVNDIFYSIMTKSLGNIQYTEDAALYPGAGYPETEREGQARTELLLLDTGEDLFLSMDEEKGRSDGKRRPQ